MLIDDMFRRHTYEFFSLKTEEQWRILLALDLVKLGDSRQMYELHSFALRDAIMAGRVSSLINKTRETYLLQEADAPEGSLPKDLLTELKVLYSRTTPGKWWAEGRMVNTDLVTDDEDDDGRGWNIAEMDGSFSEKHENARFIAEVHNMVPALIQEIETLRSAVRPVEKRLDTDDYGE